MKSATFTGILIALILLGCVVAVPQKSEGQKDSNSISCTVPPVNQPGCLRRFP
jgi:hypothetical protein